MLLISGVCCAGLDEVVLHSADKKCAIRYLTVQEKDNRTIKTNRACPEGWVNGYASVTIDAPNQQMQEILTGFFLDGYWVDRFPARGKLQDRTNPQENIQALTYILDTDKEDDITFLVQLRAERQEERLYSAFQGCPIFRLLAVVKDQKLFQNDVFLERLAAKAFMYARRLCSQLETIVVFGATKLNARANDIVFQMQIDAQTKERTIVSPETDFKNADINEPIELRQEASDILLSVEPNEDQLLINYTPPKVPKFKDDVPQETDVLKITSLMHLDVQSRLTNRKAYGRIIVHINTIDLDGTAQVDKPQPVVLKYHPNLKVGWAIVQGYFYNGQMQVNEITFCQKEWCEDVS